MWNLVAAGTREGDVFDLLFTKLEQQRQSLGGQVFDVLGEGRVFSETPLRELLVEAIRYGDRPEVRARLEEVIEEAIGERLSVLARERALASDVLSNADIEAIRERMEEAEARRLQPHFIRSFFQQAFTHLGGRMVEREPERFEITHVPADIRARDRQIGSGAPVLRRYERVTFEKELRSIPGKPLAGFICPGHPLLDATVDIVLERYRSLLKQGAVLVAPEDSESQPRALVYLEHAIQDARTTPAGGRQIASRRLQFVELDTEGTAADAGYAPYLDYRPPTDEELVLAKPVLDAEWLVRDLDADAVGHAIAELVPQHLAEVRDRTVRRVEKTMAAVRDRLAKEITYWDSRALDLKLQEEAGKQPRMNSERARQRADELQARLRVRETDLERERDVSALPPVVVGGAVIIPEGLIWRARGEAAPDVQEKERNERAAVEAVIAAERALGREPLEMPRNNPGFDIRSKDPSGDILFIEVKARIPDATTVCVTKTEILTALNKPETFVLALVTVDNGQASGPVYVRRPFAGSEDAFFDTASVNYKLPALMAKGTEPC